IEFARVDLAGQLTGFAREYADIQRRVLSFQLGDDLRQRPHARDDCADGDSAREFTRRRAGQFEAVVKIDQMPDIGQQLAPGGVQYRQPTATVKELSPEFVFDGAHLKTDRRLSQRDLLGRLGKRAVMGDGEKTAQKADTTHKNIFYVIKINQIDLIKSQE